MAKTVTAVALDLAGYIGKHTIVSLEPHQQARILADINAVRQTLFFFDKSDFWAASQTGDFVRAPQTLSGLTLTFGSTAISGAGLASWMDGCTITAGDDTAQNRIKRTGDTTYTLEAPYVGTGATGTGTAIVWQDCLNRPITTVSIDRPVMVEGHWELLPMKNIAEARDLFRPGNIHTDYGERPTDSTYPTYAEPRQAGTPRLYMVANHDFYDGSKRIQIRLSPMPDQQYSLRWPERVLPAEVTSLTDTTAVLCPLHMEESLFMPLVRDAFSSFPLFQGKDDKISKQAEVARAVINKTGEAQTLSDDFISTRGGW